MKTLSAFILFLSLSLNAVAEDSTQVQYDNRKIEVAPLDKTIIDKYQSDDDFNYYQKPKESVTVWEAVKRWFRELLVTIFGQKVVADVNNVLVYLIFGAAVLLAVVLLIRTQKSSLFYSPARKLGYEVNDENIHEIDFEEQINAAVSEGDLRKATRLIYLYAIKMLSDKNLIRWVPGKTNHEYLEEIKSEELKAAFSGLGFYFEYVWYGHFEVGEATFNKMKNLFNNIRSTQDLEA